LNTRNVTIAAMIAAVYVALTYATYEISFLGTQFRISEALTVLPFFIPAAVPGLFVGCLIANVVSPLGPLDMIFGPLATLLAAILSMKCRKLWMVPLPPIAVNAAVIGAILYYYIGGAPFWVFAASVGLGQAGVLFLLGTPLMLWLHKTKLIQKLGYHESH
jgi:uncharacterized membrane protein